MKKLFQNIKKNKIISLIKINNVYHQRHDLSERQSKIYAHQDHHALLIHNVVSELAGLMSSFYYLNDVRVVYLQALCYRFTTF